MAATEFQLHIENQGRPAQDGAPFERRSPATVSAAAVIASARSITPATLASGATPDMAIYAAEAFGPATTLVRACGENHAVGIARDAEYGPTRATFARDTLRRMAVAKRRETGIVSGNVPAVGDEARMSFEGIRAGGYGRFGGAEAMDEFAELRRTAIEDPSKDSPIRG